MYYDVKTSVEIQGIIRDNSNLWAIGERHWQAEAYQEILTKDYLSASVPFVFFLKELTHLSEVLETVRELYLFNSEKQIHLVRLARDCFAYHVSIIEKVNAIEHSYQTICAERDSRYRFANQLKVFSDCAIDKDIIILDMVNTHKWRFYHA